MQAGDPKRGSDRNSDVRRQARRQMQARQYETRANVFGHMPAEMQAAPPPTVLPPIDVVLLDVLTDMGDR